MSARKLRDCPACEHRVSTEANACPHCGHPLEKERLSVLQIIGFILTCIVIASFFVGNKKEETDKAPQKNATQKDAAQNGEQQKTSPSKADGITRYNREFSYDVEKLALRKFDLLKMKKEILFNESLSTDDTDVFSGIGYKDKRTYILLSKSGKVIPEADSEFERVKKHKDVLICETGIDGSSNAGERIYFIRNGNIFLTLDNNPVKFSDRYIEREIVRIGNESSSNDFFILELNKQRSYDDRHVIINKNGQIIYSYDYNEIVSIYNNIAIILSLKTYTRDIVHLPTGNIIKKNIKRGNFHDFIYNNLVGLVVDDTYFFIDSAGKIIEEGKMNFRHFSDDPEKEIIHESDDIFVNSLTQAFLLYKKDGKYGLKDFRGNILSNAIFPDQRSAVIAFDYRYKNTGEVPYFTYDQNKEKFIYRTADGNPVEKIDGMEVIVPGPFSENISSTFFYFTGDKHFFGYFDKEFNWVIPPVLEDASPFKNGVAWVKYKGEWLLIRNPLLQSQTALEQRASPRGKTATEVPDRPQQAQQPAEHQAAVDVAGEWERIKVPMERGAGIAITNRTERSFDFEFNGIWNMNVGEIDGTATFISPTKAVFTRAESYCAGEGAARFEFFNDVMKITTENEFCFGFGLNVSMAGEYAKRAPMRTAGREASLQKPPAAAPSPSSMRISPSFDCAKAATAVERAICADAEISRLDADMAAKYKQAMQASANREALRAEQRQWLKQRDGCAGAADTAACLRQRYRARLSQL